MKDLKASIIVRNINLYLLSDISLDSIYKDIYEDLKVYLNDLNLYKPEVDVSRGCIFYGKDESKIYFDYDYHTNVLFIDYNILNFFISKYDLNKLECLNIFGNILKNHVEYIKGVGYYNMYTDNKFELVETNINFL